MVVMWILTRKRNACTLVKLSKETDIRVVRLIRILYCKHPKIKLTEALRISKAINIPLIKFVDIQIDIQTLYHI